MRKEALRAALLARLEADLATARAAHEAAIEGATHEEARAENDKDTRGLEQSYLARGLAQRVAELEAAVAAVPTMTVATPGRVAIGAVVSVEEDGSERRFFLAAHGGGIVLPGDITVITPTSPIGCALLGRGVDDECEAIAAGKRRTLVVVRIE